MLQTKGVEGNKCHKDDVWGFGALDLGFWGFGVLGFSSILAISW